MTSVYTATVRVWVEARYSMIEEDSSLMTVTQLMIAPEITPGIIMGRVTSRKERSSDAPSETAASSMEGLIWLMMAVLERMV